jgi:uncharacterized phage protein (TIGR01671 family)
MRDIKFRGKRLDNGEWVYGDLVQIEGSYIYDYDIGDNGVEQKPILSQIKWNVNPETVGQYTGLKDKNGVEVYEGDIVTACWYDYEEPNHDMTGIVEFTEGWMSYWIADYDKKKFSELNGQGYYHWTIEVIGNIYDNPELLDGER